MRLGADRGRPTIRIDAPERGDTLTVVPGHLVPVRGRVEPGVGRKVGLVLSVNGGAGEPIPVDEDGAFEAVVPARAGLNTIELQAVNAASRRRRAS